MLLLTLLINIQKMVIIIIRNIQCFYVRYQIYIFALDSNNNNIDENDKGNIYPKK